MTYTYNLCTAGTLTTLYCLKTPAFTLELKLDVYCVGPIEIHNQGHKCL